MYFVHLFKCCFSHPAGEKPKNQQTDVWIKTETNPSLSTSAWFFSLSAKKLLVDRQMLHRDTLYNCFCHYISAKEKNEKLIRGNRRPKKPLQQRKESLWSTCYSSVIVASSVLQEFALLGSRKCVLGNVLNWEHCTVFLGRMLLWFT